SSSAAPQPTFTISSRSRSAPRGMPHMSRADAARFAAIRADILANLSQVRLSPKMIARRHNVTERYVHLLFEETGATFSEFVAQARLDRARELLLDPTANGAKISDIAQRVGYGEITTFNRAFRRRFGDTPSGLRRQ
ncbi:MAG: helix-turn-helix transcriptional regulator, partial [Rhodoplanes sp.]